MTCTKESWILVSPLDLLIRASEQGPGMCILVVLTMTILAQHSALSPYMLSRASVRAAPSVLEFSFPMKQHQDASGQAHACSGTSGVPRKTRLSRRRVAGQRWEPQPEASNSQRWNSLSIKTKKDLWTRYINYFKIREFIMARSENTVT